MFKFINKKTKGQKVIKLPIDNKPFLLPPVSIRLGVIHNRKELFKKHLQNNLNNPYVLNLLRVLYNESLDGTPILLTSSQHSWILEGVKEFLKDSHPVAEILYGLKAAQNNNKLDGIEFQNPIEEITSN